MNSGDTRNSLIGLLQKSSWKHLKGGERIRKINLRKNLMRVRHILNKMFDKKAKNRRKVLYF